MYMVQKEIDDAESSRHPGNTTKKNAPSAANPKNTSKNIPGKSSPTLDDRSLRKQIGNLEKNIAKLDQQKKSIHEQLMASSDPQAAMKLHEEMTKVSAELETAETRWADLQEQLEQFEE